MDLPEKNRRLRQVIENKSPEGVSKFSEMIGISQQKVNRLFNIDTRTNKYPSIPTDVLAKITEMFVDIDPKWILTGEGSMFIGDKYNDKAILSVVEESTVKFKKNECPICAQKDRTIEILQKQIEDLKNDKKILENDREWLKHRLEFDEAEKNKRN